MMRKGLTLIEVCVTIVIFLVLLLSMMAVFQQGFKNLGTSRERTTALNIAKGILEEYSDWNMLARLDANPGVFPHTGPSEDYSPYTLSSETLNAVTYTSSIDITHIHVPLTNPTPYYQNSIKRLTATVSWIKEGQTFTVSLSTLKASL